MASMNLEDVQGLRGTMQRMDEDRDVVGKALEQLREAAETTNSGKLLKTVESALNAFKALGVPAESYNEKGETLVRRYEIADEALN